MNTTMNIQRISIGRLKPAKYNPRKDLKPGDPAYEKIKRSMKDFGYVDPVIWNEVTGIYLIRIGLVYLPAQRTYADNDAFPVPFDEEFFN